jgi:hypothetical protein
LNRLALPSANDAPHIEIRTMAADINFISDPHIRTQTESI